MDAPREPTLLTFAEKKSSRDTKKQSLLIPEKIRAASKHVIIQHNLPGRTPHMGILLFIAQGIGSKVCLPTTRTASSPEKKRIL